VTVHREQSMKREREKTQQDATIRCLLLTSISICFGHHYAHLQETKDKFQKQIQKTMAQCTGIIDKRKHKYIICMKPSTPQLKAHIKTHKEGMPIRPVVNNVNAPSQIQQNN